MTWCRQHYNSDEILFRTVYQKFSNSRLWNWKSFEFQSEIFLHYTDDGKAENILKVSLDLISLPSPSVKIQIMGGKVCLFTLSKHSRQKFEFSLKLKVMGSNPSYLFKYLLIHHRDWNLELDCQSLFSPKISSQIKPAMFEMLETCFRIKR